MEKGFTAQFTNRVTPMPRQWRPTWPSARKSTFISMGVIISQISPATGRLTWASSAEAISRKTGGKAWPRAIPTTMQSATQSVR